MKATVKVITVEKLPPFKGVYPEEYWGKFIITSENTCFWIYEDGTASWIMPNEFGDFLKKHRVENMVDLPEDGTNTPSTKTLQNKAPLDTSSLVELKGAFTLEEILQLRKAGIV